jgi:hypothetical protein
LFTLLALASARAGENETQRFLGPESDWALARVALKDIQGAQGLEVAVAASGSVCVRRLDPSGDERRFLFTIPEKDALALVRLAVADDFVTAKPPERAGAPDERRPELALENALGLTKAQRRWEKDKVAALEKLEQALRALEKKTETLDPAFRGKQDPYFRPLPGVLVTVSLSMNRPDPSFELVRQEDWAKLQALLKDLAPTERLVDKDAPRGYRGMLLSPRNLDALALPRWLSVFKGTIEAGDSPRDRAYKKDEKGLEDWLKAEAKKRGIDPGAPR